MKKSFLFVVLFVFLFASKVQAAGSLKTITKDGVTYVSAETVSTNSTDSTSSSTLQKTSQTTVAETPIVPPTGFAKDTGSLINSLLQAIMVIAVLLVFGFLVLGGIEYITSGGEKSKTEAARNKIVSAIVGLIIVASSYAVFLLLLHFLGFNDLPDALNHVTKIDGTSQIEVATSSSQLKQQN